MSQRLSAAAVRRLVTELTKLQNNPPEGISVTPNEEKLTEINAVIHGPEGTPYEHGRFHVRLTIDDTFPNTPPKGIFVTKIFHPNVSEQGDICVNTLKKDWQKHYGIEHVLITVKCLLIYPNPESALNEEAGKLLLERYADYAAHARLMTEIHARKGDKCLLAAGGTEENKDPLLPCSPSQGPSVPVNSASTASAAAAKTRKRSASASTSAKERRKKNLRRL
ncbi:hypothetical protein GGI07_000553 [Coemansia sp. Benny D115]|nr:hypothetical protein GGI07_000553 [Coemansia sp. Benny D115]